MLGRQSLSLFRTGATRLTKSRPIGAIRNHGGPSVSKDSPTVSITFVQPDDTLKEVQARVGESLLQTAHRNDIDLEGACEGVCACSTCHLILPQEVYDSLEEPSEVSLRRTFSVATCIKNITPNPLLINFYRLCLKTGRGKFRSVSFICYLCQEKPSIDRYC